MRQRTEGSHAIPRDRVGSLTASTVGEPAQHQLAAPPAEATGEVSAPAPTPLQRWWRPDEVPLLALALGVVAVGLPFLVSGFQTLELAYALIFAIAILGLNLLVGFSGQISLGHGAFMAIGAFTTAIGVHRFGLPYGVTIPIAAGVCGLLGFAMGVPASRLEGIYLALATFALGVATPDVLKKQSDLTGGVKGISLPPVVSPVAALTDDQFFYLLCLAIAAVLFWLAGNILGARTGRAWRAVRDGELAALAFGVNVAFYKTLAFALSAAYAGVAGSLYGLATAFVSSDSYSFQLSIALLVGAVIGGIGTIGGAVIGGLLDEFLPIYAQQLLLPISKQVANAAPGAVQGVLLLVVLWVARGGVAGLIQSGYRRAIQSRRHYAEAASEGSG